MMRNGKGVRMANRIEDQTAIGNLHGFTVIIGLKSKFSFFYMSLRCHSDLLFALRTRMFTPHGEIFVII